MPTYVDQFNVGRPVKSVTEKAATNLVRAAKAAQSAAEIIRIKAAYLEFEKASGVPEDVARFVTENQIDWHRLNPRFGGAK